MKTLSQYRFGGWVAGTEHNIHETMFCARVVFHEDIVSAYVRWVVAGTGGSTGRAGGEV